MANFGLDIAIPFTGDPDPTLPWADDDDQLLVPGSLGLFDATHDANPMIGLPGVGADVGNIAWKRLRDLLGGGDSSSLAFTLDGTPDVASQMVTERTTMGGYHVIMSQTNDQPGQGRAIIGKAALVNYLVANPDHQYYYSRWDRLTKAALSGINPGEALIGSGTANYAILQEPNGTILPTAGGQRLGIDVQASFASALVNRFTAFGVNGHTGTTASWRAIMSLHGSYYPWLTSAYQHMAGSRIVYRAYLEDLNVSGRTYQQVHDADKALWTAAFAVGGRYYNDAFTTPAI